MSLVGIPVLGGFISKLYLSNAALYRGGLHMWVLLAALAVSTLLNVLYFMKTVITLYRPPREGFQAPAPERSPLSQCGHVGLRGAEPAGGPDGAADCDGHHQRPYDV